MNCFTSTFQDYQPIFVGAGCLAMGYMFGRHCRSIIENPVGVPTTSNATCCIQSESNYVSNNIAMNKKSMENYSNQDIAKRTKKFGKRDIGQLEIIDHYTLHEIPTKKKDVLWIQSRPFKKQKGLPIIWRESTETKFESEQDSDDEILAKRLEYFTKNASGIQASINKPKESKDLKLSKKKKKTMDVTTNCESKWEKEIVMNLQKSLSKGTTISNSSLSAVATCFHDQDECSLENTCRSSKLLYSNYISEKDKGASQLMGLDTNVIPQPNINNVPCEKPPSSSNIQFVLNNILEKHIKDNILLNKVVKMNVQCKLNKCNNNLNHVTVDNEENNKSKTMEDIEKENDILNYIIIDNEIYDRPNAKIEDLQGEKDISKCIIVHNKKDSRFEAKMEDIESENDISSQVVVDYKKGDRFDVRMEDIEGENDIIFQSQEKQFDLLTSSPSKRHG